MSTHVHVPCQHTGWHLCTICSHWELDHFSWLAVLFEGFSISGLSQCDTKKLLNDLCLHQMNSPGWSCGCSYRYHGWWKPEWEVQTHLVSFSILFLCFSLRLKGWIQSALLTPLWIQSYFRFAALQGRQTSSLWNFVFLKKYYRGIAQF